ncbi:hypothetical protein HMPREF3181_01000 [Parvimonas sp. KA00067]|nr:hypothetical protein HMPREF3181_01000 [Parvimonas sp. KA00067]
MKSQVKMKRIKKIIKTFNTILVCFLFLFCISSCKNHETQNTQQNQKENLYIQKISVNKLIEIIDTFYRLFVLLEKIIFL